MNAIQEVVWLLVHDDYIKQGLTICPECKKPLSHPGGQNDEA